MTLEQEVKVPDIGGAKGVDVIEILVKVGDEISVDTSLITLESDKASMEIPSPMAGTVTAIQVKLGDKVSEGDVIVRVRSSSEEKTTTSVQEKAPTTDAKAEADIEEAHHDEGSPESAEELETVSSTVQELQTTSDASEVIFAGPAVRRFARTLGVNLAEVRGTGPKDRISKEDVEQYVKQKLATQTSKSVFGLPEAPKVDFSQFGPIEIKSLNKIKRLTGAHVHRSWVTIPHVTHFDTADITELEAFRKLETEQTQKTGYKLTLLAFVCKAVCRALEVFPQFNASLDESGENLIYKKYYHLGIAVETPQGLVVPVIKEVNCLSVTAIAQEMARLSQKAREKGLMPNDMSGGCFTISSLGGIGGYAFTPIVNSPEVAILGLSRSSIQPIYQDGEFVPRLILPLSLSYDHRVIDGAEAARFTRLISEQLADVRRMLL